MITYQIQGEVLEIITLNSLEEGQGIGSALIAAVTSQARDCQCTRVWVTTTNDNTGAIDFYQRRGYTLREIRKGAVDQARTIKPSIPEVSEDGTAISDEIELEFLIQ